MSTNASPSRLVWSLGVVALVGFAAACGKATPQLGNPQLATLSTLSQAEMADSHLTLYLPDSSQPISQAVTQAAADQTAESLYRASSALESKLLVVDDANFKQVNDYPGGTPGLHRLAWVVVLPPQFAPPPEGRPAQPGQTPAAYPVARYLVIVIDAVSGKPIMDVMGSV